MIHWINSKKMSIILLYVVLELREYVRNTIAHIILKTQSYASYDCTESNFSTGVIALRCESRWATLPIFGLDYFHSLQRDDDTSTRLCSTTAHSRYIRNLSKTCIAFRSYLLIQATLITCMDITTMISCGTQRSRRRRRCCHRTIVNGVTLSIGLIKNRRIIIIVRRPVVFRCDSKRRREIPSFLLEYHWFNEISPF